MTVNVTKPSINLREKLSELHKPSGIAGERLLRSETSQEAFEYIGAGRKNLIINGGFDVWQRGTTVNTTKFSADRWQSWMTNSGVSNRNVQCTKQTGGPIGKNSSYIRYAPQVVDTGMEKFAWGQKIEKANLDHIKSGQSLTLSFWIKKEQSLPVDNNMDIQILTPPNTIDTWASAYLWRGDSSIDQTLDSISFNSLSTEWTYYTYTFVPGDTALDRGLAVYWHIGDTDFNLNNTDPIVSFTGVQLEIGNVATPFEHVPYDVQLQRCYRYYYKRLAGNPYGPGAQGMQIGSNNVMIQGYHPVEMRTAPTMSGANWICEHSGSISSWSMGSTRVSTTAWSSENSLSGTDGNAAIIYGNNNVNAYIIGDAEL